MFSNYSRNLNPVSYQHIGQYINILQHKCAKLIGVRTERRAPATYSGGLGF
jgi:hypothetical protein